MLNDEGRNCEKKVKEERAIMVIFSLTMTIFMAYKFSLLLLLLLLCIVNDLLFMVILDFLVL